MYEKGGREAFEKRYGVTDADRASVKGLAFFNGFADADFPWYFAAGPANAAADHFVAEGRLSMGQKNQFTLHDWANIIGSGWFARLAHSLALTTNGIYGTFGRNLRDYDEDALKDKLLSQHIITNRNDPIFEYKEQVEPADGLVYATTSLTRVAVRGLRTKMQDAKSF